MIGTLPKTILIMISLAKYFQLLEWFIAGMHECGSKGCGDNKLNMDANIYLPYLGSQLLLTKMAIANFSNT